ncbi:Na+/H+ antiporter [Spongisporangium articulatum]|uniref:Na+/H+ antiporter n=1 Tax=Spongisporangium articulatum TaxID=3362603 RepID=A0ABW8ATF4_9ACTN
MHLAVDLVALLALAAATAGFATRLGLSAPLVLTALGLVLSFVPGVPVIELEPDVVLLGILPPLLYATAIRTPWVDIRRNRRKIALLSVGLVLFSSFAVALVVHAVLPQVDFALALALGAVVAPPDAVAASAVARRVSMPRGVVSLLEGESLLNDATALVTLRTALAAVAGSVSLLGAGGDFALAVAVGGGVGWVLAQVAAQVRRRVEDPVLDTTLSLVLPYAAYLAAEELHGSGVIAVVVAGLMLGHRSPEIQSAASRVTERVIWRTVQFLLESAVFLLIGLQIKGFVDKAIEDDIANTDVAVLCAAVLGTVVAVRMLWIYPATYLPRLIPAVRRAEPEPPSWRAVTLVGWAGMRGVVTLAAVLTIPAEEEGYPALVVAAFTVVAGTLLLQGTTLPWLVRALKVRGPDPVADALQVALVQQRAVRAGLARLDEKVTDDDPEEVVGPLRNWGERVANAAWERLGGNGSGSGESRETPAATFQRLRTEMLTAEREVAVELRRSGSLPSDLVEQVLERIDEEEAMLGRFAHRAGAEMAGRSTALTTPAACEHLASAPVSVSPDASPDACPDCLAIGDHNWVHMRMCVECGHVGCCDSSPNRHSHVHFEKTAHPVMRSIELGEDWRWCWVDSELG